MTNDTKPGASSGAAGGSRDPDVSVIVVSYETADLLAACLESVRAAAAEGVSVETFVVDNASRDGSPELVEREFPEVRLVRHGWNAGFAAGCNVGLALARGRHVLLLNPDAELLPGALATLVAHLDEHPQVGYCGPRLEDAAGRTQPSARRFPTVFSSAWAMLGGPQRRPGSRHTVDLHAAHGYERDLRADWLSGACLLVRREAIDDVGPLDDGFFLYFEELDWCRRMADAGWEGAWVAGATARHVGGASVGREPAGLGAAAAQGPTAVAGDVADAARPFDGNAPVHWVRSSRRYLRRHHGAWGHFLAHGSQVLLHLLVVLRHLGRDDERRRAKVTCAWDSIRHLVG